MSHTSHARYPALRSSLRSTGPRRETVPIIPIIGTVRFLLFTFLFPHMLQSLGGCLLLSQPGGKAPSSGEGSDADVTRRPVGRTHSDG